MADRVRMLTFQTRADGGSHRAGRNGTMAFVVELPPGGLPAAAVERLVRAVVGLLRRARLIPGLPMPRLSMYHGPMRADLLRGHLDGLLLAVLAEAPGHGYELSQRLTQRSGGELGVHEGSLYPALHRLERGGLVESAWSTGDGTAPADLPADAGRPPRGEGVAAGMAGLLHRGRPGAGMSTA